LWIDEETRADLYERLVVEGVWIQTIGQILEAIAVTKESLANEKPIELEATTMADIGDMKHMRGNR
jgi:nicotinate-nucleotide pyrophosphorylase